MRLILLLCLFSSSVFAWGPIGHRVVGQLAEKRLTPVARAQVKAILGKYSLADVANWADAIRSDPKWDHASSWHYVTIEDGKKYDRKLVSRSGDVITAIEQFKRDLADPKVPAQKKLSALAFLVHFIGDIHQPLHVGRGADRGGNDIAVKWFGKKTNLHVVWDEKLLEMEQLSYTEYAKFIDKSSEAQKATWARSNLLDWAMESQSHRQLVYALPKKFDRGWEYKYRFSVISITHQRLEQAGVRLAATLNDIFKAKKK